ncbi:hypothetical protein SORBI_3003G195400 [Sorghum bicolor]|uniref:Uncharacterized protein n=1 Tax=Sorghum bicolor TaxID=4558 RepID=A0A1B6Q4C2_SORBI|nr:hypothetical protein SORBI_3003G195400 [Sorghum bicolor]
MHLYMRRCARCDQVARGGGGLEEACTDTRRDHSFSCPSSVSLCRDQEINSRQAPGRQDAGELTLPACVRPASLLCDLNAYLLSRRSIGRWTSKATTTTRWIGLGGASCSCIACMHAARREIVDRGEGTSRWRSEIGQALARLTLALHACICMCLCVACVVCSQRRALSKFERTHHVPFISFSAIPASCFTN